MKSFKLKTLELDLEKKGPDDQWKIRFHNWTDGFLFINRAGRNLDFIWKERFAYGVFRRVSCARFMIPGSTDVIAVVAIVAICSMLALPATPIKL